MSKRHIYLEDVPLDEARAKLQAALTGRWAVWHRCPAKAIALGTRRWGASLPDPWRAKLSSPHYHCAAMDGYAVAAADTVDARETQALSLEAGAARRRRSTPAIPCQRTRTP